MSLSWQLITFCLETSAVSLLPFSIALCSQLAGPRDTQRFCRLCVSVFSTDCINWISKYLWTDLWMSGLDKVVLTHFSLFLSLSTTKPRINQGPTGGDVWKVSWLGTLGPEVFRIDRHLKTTLPNRRCAGPGISQPMPHRNRKQPRYAHSFCDLT